VNLSLRMCADPLTAPKRERGLRRRRQPPRQSTGVDDLSRMASMDCLTCAYLIHQAQARDTRPRKPLIRTSR
jgi:hypothetical protein